MRDKSNVAKEYVLEGLKIRLNGTPDIEFRAVMMKALEHLPLYLLIRMCKDLGNISIGGGEINGRINNS